MERDGPRRAAGALRGAGLVARLAAPATPLTALVARLAAPATPLTALVARLPALAPRSAALLRSTALVAILIGSPVGAVPQALPCYTALMPAAATGPATGSPSAEESRPATPSRPTPALEPAHPAKPHGRARIPDPRSHDTRRVVFIAGTRSHGYGAHEHHAGSLLLARLLASGIDGIEVAVHRDGWPDDPTALEGADAIVIFANGGPNHPALPHLDALGRMMDRGVGLVLLHYAVEVPTDAAGAELLDWVGGYFDTHWSVNPIWSMQSLELPDHPIARGVAPYEIEDEWYYHMRFRDGMAGVEPILTALPPASSLEREDGPHSGNPHVRAAVLERGEPQHLAWAAERPGGGRGFGFTGAHFHWNWGHPMQRRLVLNAIAWAAGAEVPLGGVDAGVVTMEDLEAHQDYEPNERFDRARWVELVDRWHRDYGAPEGAGR